jgi:hypothetical protein
MQMLGRVSLLVGSIGYVRNFELAGGIRTSGNILPNNGEGCNLMALDSH